MIKTLSTFIIAVVLLFSSVGLAPREAAASYGCSGFARIFSDGTGYSSAYCASSFTLTTCLYNTTFGFFNCRSGTYGAGSSATVWAQRLCTSYRYGGNVYAVGRTPGYEFWSSPLYLKYTGC